jgi:threonine dehydrogenase-like Zn-dependent dehydrogenase
MKALQFSRKPAKYAAGLVAGSLRPGSGAKYGPISLRDIEPPAAPGPDWLRFRPRLAGICGSDLATIDGKSSRYFEPIVTFPFVPGHEVVGDLDDESRAVLIPVLSCVTRSIDPPCPGCAAGAINRCERIAFGHLEPGLQSGFCEDTGGGWSTSMVAHTSQLFPVADDMSDEAAVMIEPTACAVHAATRVDEDLVVVIGAGTLGLLTIAALDDTTEVIATARYPEQRRLAAELGATRVVEPGQLDRAVRSRTGSLRFGTQLTGGAPLVIDCVGSQESLSQALRVVAPGGEVLVVGMPATTTLDLTGLWHREVAIRGCYAYDRTDFDRAATLVTDLDLGRLVSATYPLADYTGAIAHAASAGPRGAVKIAFDLRPEKERER